MKSIMTTALLLAGFIGVLGALGPALDAQPAPQERSFTQKANAQCGNADWRINDNGDVVCQPRKPLNLGRVKL